MQAARTNEVIISGVDEMRFISHIRELFSSSTVALSEVAQNSRRASATKVMYDFSDDGTTLVITDDGTGVENFQALVVVASSGWSEEMLRAESPFGIGFSSVAFSADSVTVESKGKMVTFATDDLIAKRPIHVLHANFIGGTRLTLKGFKIQKGVAVAALRELAKGFPIPVIVDGEDLPRPHAKAGLSGIETGVGFVHIPGIHSEHFRAFGFRGYVYCQGLPVKAAQFTNPYHRPENGPIVHIDHARFVPRCPDRDSLIDADNASAEIESVLRQSMREHLQHLKATMSAERFAATYWKTAEAIRCLDLMNDVGFLPDQVLSFINDDLRQASYGESCWGTPTSGITRQMVESGDVVLFQPDLCDEVAGGNFAKMAFVRKKGWMLVDPLPDGHWAQSHVLDLEATPCQITGNILASDTFFGHYVGGALKIVENLAVTMLGTTGELDQAIVVEGGEFDGILVPPTDSDPAHVLLQASTYEDSNERYGELEHSQDISDFNNAVAVLRGENPEESLRKCCAKGDAGSRSNLRGRSFKVDFDSEGKFEVTAL